MAKQEGTKDLAPGISGIDTKTLRAMRDLCPEKPGESVTFTVAGRAPVKLTIESRARANAELKRRGSR